MTTRFYDNTRVSDSRKCLRFFYFRHVRHWELEGFRAALAFGAAWHKGMDVIWEGLASGVQNLNVENLCNRALSAFEDEWERQGGIRMMEMSAEDATRLAPRLPGTALEMFYEYVDARKELIQRHDFELVDIERPFAVPLHPDDDKLFYVGRLDKVFQLKGNLFIGEHKTTTAYKRDGGFRQSFVDSFSPNSQIDGYLYASHVIYGRRMKSVWVDAALVHKDVHDAFKFIPIDRTTDQLDAWLWETVNQVEIIESHKRRLEELENPEALPYLPAFPKNTNSCFDFGVACPYLTVCKMWSNPHGKEMPAGFRESRWEPFDELGLAKIGLEPEDV